MTFDQTQLRDAGSAYWFALTASLELCMHIMWYSNLTAYHHSRQCYITSADVVHTYIHLIYACIYDVSWWHVIKYSFPPVFNFAPRGRLDTYFCNLYFMILLVKHWQGKGWHCECVRQSACMQKSLIFYTQCNLFSCLKEKEINSKRSRSFISCINVLLPVDVSQVIFVNVTQELTKPNVLNQCGHMTTGQS